MKQWPALALIIVGLAYVIGAQLLLHERRAPQQSVASASETVPAPRPKPKPLPAVRDRPMAFGGYPCRADCADDKAGYRWAKANQIVDPDDCTGKTGPFIEGCRVYARQQLR